MEEEKSNDKTIGAILVGGFLSIMAILRAMLNGGPSTPPPDPPPPIVQPSFQTAVDPQPNATPEHRTDRYWIVYCEQVAEEGRYGNQYFDRSTNSWKPFVPKWYPTEALPSGTVPVSNSGTFIELDRIPLTDDGVVELVKREGLVLRYEGPYDTAEQAAAAAAAAALPERYVRSVLVWTRDWDAATGDAPQQYIEQWGADFYNKCEREHPTLKVSYADGYGWYFKKVAGPYSHPADMEEAIKHWKNQGYRLRRVDRN